MSFDLLREIKTGLQTTFAETVFRNPAVEDETEDNAFISPSLYLGTLPPKRQHGRTNEDFPFIVIRAASGEDREGESELVTEIIFGVYTAEDEGGGTNDIQNVLGKIRGYFLQNRLLDKRYNLQLPLRWALGIDEDQHQPHPYYLGQVTAAWTYPRPDHLENTNEELDVYGSGYL
jgi:hypothetical protein